MAKNIDGEIIPQYQQDAMKLQQKLQEAAALEQKVNTPSLIADDSGNLMPTTDSSDISMAALSQGHTVNPEETFTVKKYDGTIGEVSGANLQTVLASGDYILEAKEERALREDQEKYGDKTVQAAALGAARGLSFGGSDVLLSKSGIYTGEELRGIESANKPASIGGEIVGAVAPALLSGGTSTAASAARVVGSGIRATEVLGAKAAAGVAERLAAKAALRAEGVAAKEATLGAKALTEAGEAVASGASTISKEGAEAATSLLTKSLEKSGYKASQAKDIASKMLYGSAEYMAPEAANLAVQGALQGAGRLVTEDVFGTADFNAENLLSYAGVGALFGGTFGAAIGAGKALVPKVSDLASPVTSFIGRKTSDIAESVVGKEAAVLNMFDMTPAALAKAQAKRPNFNQLLSSEADDIFKIYNPKNEKEFAQAVLTRRAAVGREIGDIVKETDEVLAKSLSQAETAVVQKPLSIEDLTNRIRIAADDHLASLGSAVTKSEKEALFNVSDDFITNLSKEFKDSNIITASNLKSMQDDLAKRIYPQGMKGPTLLTMADQSATAMRKAMRDAIKEEQAALIRQASNIQGSIIGKGSLVDRLAKANQSYSVLSDVVFNSRKAIAKEALTSGIDGIVDLKDAAVFVASPEAGFAFKLLRSGLKSYEIQKRIAMGSLEESSRKISSSIKSGLSGLSKGAKVLAKGTQPSLTRSLVSSQLAVKYEDGKKIKPKNEVEAYNNIIDNATEALTNPEGALKHANKQTAALYEHAPNTASAIDAKYLQILQFIGQKAKKNGSKKTGVFDTGKNIPSGFETAKMARYLDAITNPQSMVEKAASGKLSREHVEVMKTIFPEMHKQMKDSVLNYLSTQKAKGTPLSMTYQQKLQLGQILDIQAHESMAPENVAGLQSLFSQEPGTDTQTDFTAARADNLEIAEKTGSGVYDYVDTES